MHSRLFHSVGRKPISAPWIALFTVSWMASATPNTRNVDCSRGESAAEALAKADPGDTINIVGTCRERLVVTTDRITLQGQGSATLDGGGNAGGSFAAVIAIRGARGSRSGDSPSRTARTESPPRMVPPLESATTVSFRTTRYPAFLLPPDPRANSRIAGCSKTEPA